MPGKKNSQPQADIAIIGMSCLFPGADGLDAFWGNILGKVDAVGAPAEDWGARRYHDSHGSNRISTVAGGFLKDLYRFDPAELGVMPNSIDGSEPDQFLALRVAREALADGGYLRDDYDHVNTGIILGHSTYLHRGNANVVQHGVVIDQTISLLRQFLPELGDDEVERLRTVLCAKLPPFNPDVAPGLVPNVMTGRIANKLNFMGPNYLIDAACASSLLAVLAAAEELKDGRSDLMLAGGVNASIPAEVYMVFNQLGALSRGSKIQPFAAGADGMVLGEGLGIVVLKRLGDAERDGDRVYAVVKGVGQSSDGKGLGLLAPRMEGEVLAFQRAFAQADVAPASVGLIEAHGTGVPLGDQTEIAALAEVYGPRGDAPPTCALGSVKSMIGHCIPAAGAAGLIKAALALYYKVLPPTLCDEVSGELGIENTPLYINTEARPWVHGKGTPRRAGVNAFGFGGVNSHAILEEAPGGDANTASAKVWPCELFVFAAETRAELIATMAAAEEALRDGRLAGALPAEIAMALAGRAAAGKMRLAIVAVDAADLMEKLAKARGRLAEEGRRRLQLRSGVYFSQDHLDGGLAFIFPGEGAQYQGMLSDLLMCFPQARQWFDFWDTVFGAKRGFLPSQCVFPPPTTLDKPQAEALQKHLFSIEVGSESTLAANQALLAVLDGIGLKADAVVGHSSGENSALLAAGVIPTGGWQGLTRYIRKLNRMYQEIEAAGQLTTGALLTVGAVPRARVLEVAEANDVHLALDNCHHQAVLFGPPDVMKKVAAQFRGEGGLCSFLPFDRPYHTPLFAPVAGVLERIYAGMKFRSPAIPVYSCATASRMPDDPGELRRLAAEQWCSRVRFTETIEQMHDDGIRFFVEVGPSSNLTGFTEDILQGREFLAVSLDNQKRSSVAQLMHALGRLWVHGRDVPVLALFQGRGLAPADLERTGPAPTPRERVFANTLPFVTLSDEEAAELRHGLRPAVDKAGAMPAAQETEDGETGGGGQETPWLPASDDAAGSEIVRGHFEMMRAFLVSQERIMNAALAELPAEDTAASAPVLPFLHRIVRRDEDEAAAECDLSAERDQFLRHHVLYASHISNLDPDLHGLAVVPLAVSLEMVCEIAALLSRMPRLARLENVRAHDWIALDGGERTLVLTAGRRQSDPGEERFAAVISGDGVPLFEAEVVFSEDAAHDGERLPALTAPKPPLWQDHELYTTGMFHGPLFHSVRRLIAWDETGLDVELGDTFVDGFFEAESRPAFLLNPVLLDAIGHVTAFWIAQ